MSLDLEEVSPHLGGVRTQSQGGLGFSERLGRKLIDKRYSTVGAHIESWTVLGSTLGAVSVAHE